MRIVVVASLAFSLVNFRKRLLADMVACGHEVLACAPEDDREVARELAAMGVAYRVMPMVRSGLNPFADLRTLAWLIGLFRAQRPGLVLAYTQKPIVYAGIASRIARVPRYFAMVSGLGLAFGEEGGRWLRAVVALLYRVALKRAEGVFVFNADDREEMLRHHMIRADTNVVRVPGSGVDLDHYGAAPIPAGPVRFLMIARLLHSKGLSEYAEAARRLRRRYPEARFALLGPPDPSPAGIDAAQVEEWRREGAIRYLGEARDVRPYLAAASVFVLPSWYREGLPRTILEAMATGRAVITTDMPGCREPVEPGANGYLVPPRDAAGLATAMERFLLRPELVEQMGARARATAVERFSVERVNDILLSTMRLRTDTAARPSERGAAAALAGVTS